MVYHTENKFVSSSCFQVVLLFPSLSSLSYQVQVNTKLPNHLALINQVNSLRNHSHSIHITITSKSMADSIPVDIYFTLSTISSPQSFHTQKKTPKFNRLWALITIEGTSLTFDHTFTKYQQFTLRSITKRHL